jgi:CheY-like chemotaxis protein
MRKILLVIEEYQELVALENLLRRIGFDVLSVSKDMLITDALARFAPDIVIASFKGRAVDGAKVAARFRKNSPTTRIALTCAKNNASSITPEVQELVDAFIMLPAQPHNVIRVVCGLGQLDFAPILAKYQKISAQKPLEANSIFVNGDSGLSADEVTPSSASRGAPQDLKQEMAHVPVAELRTERSDGYDRFLSQNNDDVSGLLSHEKVAEAMRKLKQASQGEQAELDRIDAEKRAFVKTLFEESQRDVSKKSSTNKPRKK